MGCCDGRSCDDGENFEVRIWEKVAAYMWVKMMPKIAALLENNLIIMRLVSLRLLFCYFRDIILIDNPCFENRVPGCLFFNEVIPPITNISRTVQYDVFVVSSSVTLYLSRITVTKIVEDVIFGCVIPVTL